MFLACVSQLHSHCSKTHYNIKKAFILTLFNDVASPAEIGPTQNVTSSERGCSGDKEAVGNGKSTPVTKHHAIKTHGGVDIKLHIILLSTVDEGQFDAPASLSPAPTAYEVKWVPETAIAKRKTVHARNRTLATSLRK
jgi:hypothetical protein